MFVAMIPRADLQTTARPVQLDGEILENRQVTPVTWIMKIHAPELATAIQAGQFVNLRTTKSIVPLLRRPMSVHRVIQHGRKVCTARRPNCEQCSMKGFCPRVGVAGD